MEKKLSLLTAMLLAALTLWAAEDEGEETAKTVFSAEVTSDYYNAYHSELVEGFKSYNNGVHDPVTVTLQFTILTEPDDSQNGTCMVGTDTEEKGNAFDSEATMPSDDKIEKLGFPLKIPSTIEHDGKTYDVTEIGQMAFADKKSVTTLILPETITKIGEKAFEGCKFIELEMLGQTPPEVIDETLPCAIVNIPLGSYKTYRKSNSKVWKSIPLLSVFSASCKKNETETVSVRFGVFGDSKNCRVGTGGLFNAIPHDAEGKITIPSTAGNYNVNEISSYAFNGCPYITEIVLPSSATKISHSAFSASSIERMEIPDGVQEIDDYWFLNCNNLEEVVFPQSVTKIHEKALAKKPNLSTITIAKDNSTYSDGGCNVVMENETQKIIRVCKGTNGIPEGTKVIGDEAFLEINFASETTFTMPSSVDSIGVRAFQGCGNLVKADLSAASKVWLGHSAFFGCHAEEGKTEENNLSPLKEIILPANMKGIDGTTFGDNHGLETITVVGDGTYTSAFDDKEYNAVYEKSTMKLITGCKNTKIAPGTKAIGDDAFRQCSTFNPQKESDDEKVADEDFLMVAKGSLETIGNGAFTYCSALQKVKIPNSVTSIGYNAFAECSKLESVVFEPKTTGELKLSTEGGIFAGCRALTGGVDLPSGIKTIPTTMFMGSGVTSITLHEEVESISSLAFAFTPLGTITVMASTPPEIDTTDFSSFFLLSTQGSVTVKVPSSALETYKKTGWNNINAGSTTIEAIGEEEATISSAAVRYAAVSPRRNAAQLVSIDGTASTVSVPETIDGMVVESIADNAFAESTEATTIDLSQAKSAYVNEVDRKSGAFGGVDDATLIYLPIGNTTVTGNNVVNTDTEGNTTSESISLSAVAEKAPEINVIIHAGSVSFERSFVAGEKSTIFLPFAIPAEEAAQLGKFYAYRSHTADKVVFEQVKDGTKANTPYVFEPLNGGTINIADAKIEPNVPTDGNFVGTYERIVFDGTEGAYGYSGQTAGGIGAGTFVKFGKGASLRPYRAYLKLSAAGAKSYAMVFNETTESTEEAETTDIATLPTTASADNTEWYSTNGVKQNGQLSGKGIYIGNGKKVSVK